MKNRQHELQIQRKNINPTENHQRWVEANGKTQTQRKTDGKNEKAKISTQPQGKTISSVEIQRLHANATATDGQKVSSAVKPTMLREPHRPWKTKKIKGVVVQEDTGGYQWQPENT